MDTTLVELLNKLLDYLTQTGETLASSGFALIVKQQSFEALVYHTWGIALVIAAVVILLLTIVLFIHELDEGFVIGSVFMFFFAISLGIAAGMCLQSAYYHSILPEYQALKEIISVFGQ